MRRKHSIGRRTGIALVAAAGLCAGASSRWGLAQQKPSAAIPVDGASSLPATQATGAAVVVAAQRVNVEFAGGKLVIDASNGSLNQILREVSQKTGIKLTGGVKDERVYGHYGPAVPGEILASLLDGTGSNMLLVANAGGPGELILTPRLGGPTPPNPNAGNGPQDNGPEPDVSQQTPQGQFGMRRGVGATRSQVMQAPEQQSQDGTPPAPMPETNPADAAAAASDSSTSTDSSQSPNGTKTPQQIYDQLRQLQQQQSQQTTPQ